jgi:hypothetical protein
LKIGELIRANRRITVLELLQEVGISVGSVEEILHNELKVSKVSARWVPRLLSPEHRERRLVAVTELLQRYEREGAEFLDLIVTCCETLVHISLLNQKKQASSANTPSLHTPKSESNCFQRGRSWLLCSGIPRVSFTWTFWWSNNHQSAVLFNYAEWESGAGDSLKAKKKAGFSLLPPGQRSSSHCGFNSTETEVRCPASSSVQSWLSCIWLSFVWTNEGGFRRQEIWNNDDVIAAVQSWIHEQPKTLFETGIKKLQNVGRSLWQSAGTAVERSVRLLCCVGNCRNFGRHDFSFQFERP